MRIDNWFKGSATCDRSAYIPDAPGYFEPDGEGMHHCLFTQATYDRLDPQAMARLAAVIERHFPSRATCQHCDFSPISRLIHFNNHPETTREDIDKVLRVFTEEEDARRADA